MAGIELQGDVNLTLVVDGTFTVRSYGGGGGGGGNHGQGGGGFSGGDGEGGKTTGVNANGDAGNPGTVGAGGGYFADAANVSNGAYATTNGGYPGRIGGLTHKVGTFSGNFYPGGKAGDGGNGGAGGTVTLSVAAAKKLVAQNGTWDTAATSWTANPTPIYLQSGFKLDMVREKGVASVSARTGAALTQELKNKSVTQSVQPFSYDGKDIYGVGSGAGATETSNGSYAEYGVNILS